MLKFFKFLLIFTLIFITISCSNNNLNDEGRSYTINTDSIKLIECSKAKPKENGREYEPITIDNEEEITNLLLELNDLVDDYANLVGPYAQYNFKFTNADNDTIYIGINKTGNKGIVFLSITKSSGEKLGGIVIKKNIMKKLGKFMIY